MLDEVDEDRLCPLQVVDDDNLWRQSRALLEQPPECHASLLRCRGDDVPGLDTRRNEHLDERPVRDALAVGEAPSAVDVRRVAHPLEEVGDEPRLADPRRAEQREESARAIGDRVLVVAPEPLALSLTSHQRRLQMASDRLRVRDHVEKSERLDGLSLSLERERLDRLDTDGISDENARLGADEDFTRAGDLLEPCGHVDRIAGDERLALAADDDLARVDRRSEPPGRARRSQRASPTRREPRGARRPRAQPERRRPPSPRRR